MGGLYFDGGDILQIPPYSGDSNYFLMNYDQTVIMIVRPDLWSAIGATESEVLLSKSDGTNDKWTIYLDQSTRDLVLSMQGMKSVVLNAANSDQTISFGAMVDDHLWHSVAIVSELTTVSTTAYQNTYTAYVDGVQLNSAQTISDLYFKDEPTYYFTFGGTYSSGSINASYRGNLYELKVYNEAKNQAYITTNEHSIRTNDVSWCACNQCYNVSTCLNHCHWKEWFDESQVTCDACLASCQYGCWRHDDCKLSHDSKCSVANSWTDCSTCVTLTEKKVANSNL